MPENLVGLGTIGAGAAVRKLHWPVLKKIRGEVRFRGVVNRSRTTAELFASDVGAKVYDNHQALLESPDVQAVLIAVPIVDTAAILIDAIQSGKHVLVEKPLAASSEEALQIVKEVRQSRQQVAVAENFSLQGGHLLKAKQVIQSGGMAVSSAFRWSQSLIGMLRFVGTGSIVPGGKVPFMWEEFYWTLASMQLRNLEKS